MRREPVFAAEAFDATCPEERPLRHAKPFRRLRLAGRLACAAGLISALVLVAHDKATAPASPPAQGWSDPAAVAGSGKAFAGQVVLSQASPGQASTARAAVPVAAAGPLLRFDGAAEPAPRSEPPRWNPASGLREDALSQGAFDAIEAPYLLLTVTDAAQAPKDEPSLFVMLARRAADGRGLSVTHTGGHGEVASKFGLLETVEATLSGDGTRACTGFRVLGQRSVRLDGWLCGILGQAPEPRAVACALDRLVLAGQAASTVEAAFAEAETRRDPACQALDAMEAAARAGDSTGSIAAAKPVARKRAGKNEALLRRNAQAQR